MKGNILCLIRINKVDREAVYINFIKFKDFVFGLLLNGNFRLTHCTWEEFVR